MCLWCIVPSETDKTVQKAAATSSSTVAHDTQNVKNILSESK